MFPGRPSLALSLACAALLAACAAQHPRPRAAPRAADRSAPPPNTYNWQCNTKVWEPLVGTVIPVPTVYIPSGQQKASIEIIDNCAVRGLTLSGQTVQVCDAPAPDLEPPLTGHSPVAVYRLGHAAAQATLDLTQYCT